MTTKTEKSKVNAVKPLYDYLLIEPKQAETTTSSGIIIPDTANKEKPQEGTVISAGEGRMEDGKLSPLTVKVGQTVLFKKWGGTEIKLEGKDYLLIKEEDILAIIEG